ncbi:MAG: hypothetical protein HF978_07535 [Desulfobacteraceae bacterium]|nr:hypothetical protein [Desulfobacteraceae bacterium]MBC2755380.1 hypothetical protein [Desulfobacteraceae bacterium]
MKERNGKRRMNEWEENACPRCKGTGMVCGYKPEILPGACCVDFANAICPECGGTGRDLRKSGENESFITKSTEDTKTENGGG